MSMSMSTNTSPDFVRHDRAYRSRGSSDIMKPSLAGLIGKYVMLFAVLAVMVFPFLWQLSTSFKGATENIYDFPPTIFPEAPTLDNYAEVFRTIPVLNYAWHSLLVGVGTVVSNVIFATLGGYALGCLKFKGKGLIMAIFFSTLLLPGEVTLTSQYLTVKALGMANTLWGVFLPGAISAINVLLIAAACRMIPPDVLDAATIDGATTWQRLRHIVWPNIRGMVSVIALFAFIGAWDDFLWPLVVLSDPAKYTLTVGMQYLNSNFAANPRVIAAGTMIALVPIIILFATLQKQFFKGVEEGGVKQ
ncbi:Inner membrane ABC transporter permease protein ycjP [Arcanobacterium haemolyticum]|uniref:Binding-protein-dependent transport systems inner membrane component n=2 Tax=Arcanobacterium haemolyticum TaxID=28264 RepID=D7BLX3_ARCHD|nr:binding-protein-dependent transport systems inner membrane component [Arcanobacterium haemolyticum DSM 20595]SQH26968.1 Inner membrane ABC transporter permease protein ycjP [Arcanobacterium haemolyticum]